MKILYVEDNPYDIDLARRELNRAMPDVQLDVAANLAKARRQLEGRPDYDAALLDLNLPDGSGLDLLAEIREKKPALTIIVLTGSGSEEIAVAALKAGADDYLIKRADYLTRLPGVIQAARQRRRADNERHAHPLRVLYAEHNAADIDLTRRHLARYAPHIRLETTYSVAEMLDLLPADAVQPCLYDVVLIDYKLPGLNALDALKVIRYERQLSLPVVLVTGQGSEEIAVQALRLGAADYLVKHNSYLFELPAALENAHHYAQLRQKQVDLQESEARFRHLAENAADLIVRFDTDLRHLYINPALARLTGISQEEYLGKTNEELGMPPQQVAFWNRELRRVVAEGRPRTFSFQFTDAEGRLRYFETQVAPEFNSKGQIVSLLSITRDITARLETEQRLRLQSAALDAAANGIVITDIDGAIEWVNPAFTALTGYTLEEAVGKNPRDLVKSGVHDRLFYQDLWDTILSGQVWRGELVNQRKDGRLYHEEQTITPVIDEQGQITHFVAIKQDISERKEVEESFRQAQRLAQATIDSLSAHIAVLDEEGDIVAVNQSWLEFAQENEGQVDKMGVGANYLVVCDEAAGEDKEIAGQMAAGIRSVMAGDADEFTLEYPCHAPQEQRWFVAHVTPLPAKGGQKRWVVVAHENVTQRKLAEEALWIEARRLQRVMDTMPQGVILLNEAGLVTLANPEGRRYLQQLAGVEVGGRLEKLNDHSLADLFHLTANGQSYTLVHGEQLFELLTQQIDPHDPAADRALLLRDVTEEHERQQYFQVQERLAAVGQLAAGIAHDFNNVMAIIVLYTQLVQRMSDLSDKGQKYLQTVEAQAQHASAMIGQILDFSRRTLMERAPLNFLPLLKEMVKLLQSMLPETIAIELHSQESDYLVLADPTRLQQAVMNIALNARDAMPQGGSLRFSLSRLTIADEDTPPLPDIAPGDWLQLEISDSGQGIAPQHLSRIFDPFFTTKEPGKGAGLGLPQVHGIIKQHDGSIDVYSQVGVGTTMVVYLPLMAELPDEAGSPPASPDAALRGSETILLVEDNATMRDSMRDVLVELGYRVVEADNGVTALEMIAEPELAIELVISDVVMPKMGGLDLYEAAQRQRRAGLKMLLITGYPLDDSMRDLRRLDWLQKPFDLTHLAAKVRALLDSEE